MDPFTYLRPKVSTDIATEIAKTMLVMKDTATNRDGGLRVTLFGMQKWCYHNQSGFGVWGSSSLFC